MSVDRLLRIKYKKPINIVIVVIVIFIIVTLLLNKKIYDVYNTYGVISNNNLIVNIPINYSDTIVNGTKIKIENDYYDLNIISISNLLVGEGINYQEVRLKIEDEYQENMILKITIYYNKEKVLKKLMKLI